MNQAKIIRGLLIGLIFVHITCILVLSGVPPVSRDALTHHLAVPKLYIQSGKMVELPEIGFSYYPPNLDLLYLIALYYGNDIIPKYIHFGFALLTAWLIFGYLRERLDSRYALTGVLLFLSLPVIIKLSITVYVDLGLMFFCFAALLMLFKWCESGFNLRYLIYSGVLCGLALGTKYNGLLALFIMTLITAFIYVRSTSTAKAHQVGSLKYAAVFMLVSLLVFSPWMIRNYLWTGNPIYPLYNTWIKSSAAAVFGKQPASRIETAAAGPAAKKSAGRQSGIQQPSTPWNHLSIRRILYGESWLQIALIPIRIFFQGQDDNPKYFDGKLNPFLFILPFFGFYQLRRESVGITLEKKVWLAFSLLFILIAFLRYSIRIRYIAPVIPPLIILSMFGLRGLIVMLKDRLPQNRPYLITVFVILVVAAAIGLNAAYLTHQFKVVDPLSYISGRVGRDEYITRFRPAYPVIKYANQNLVDNARLLGLFMGNRRYYTERPMILSEDVFKKVVSGAASPQMITRRLTKRGITHLLIRYDLFNQWVNAEFDLPQRELLSTYFEHNLRLLISRGGYGLYEIAPFR